MFKKSWDEDNQIFGYSDEYLYGNFIDSEVCLINSYDFHPIFEHITCNHDDSIIWSTSIELLPLIKFKIK